MKNCSLVLSLSCALFSFLAAGCGETVNYYGAVGNDTIEADAESVEVVDEAEAETMVETELAEQAETVENTDSEVVEVEEMPDMKIGDPCTDLAKCEALSTCNKLITCVKHICAVISEGMCTWAGGTCNPTTGKCETPTESDADAIDAEPEPEAEVEAEADEDMVVEAEVEVVDITEIDTSSTPCVDSEHGCDDGNPCNGPEICTFDHQCVHGAMTKSDEVKCNAADADAIDAEPELEPEAEVEAEADEDMVVEAEVEVEVEADEAVVVEAEVEPEAEPEVEIELEPEADAEVETEIESGTSFGDPCNDHDACTNEDKIKSDGVCRGLFIVGCHPAPVADEEEPEAELEIEAEAEAVDSDTCPHRINVALVPECQYFLGCISSFVDSTPVHDGYPICGPKPDDWDTPKTSMSLCPHDQAMAINWRCGGITYPTPDCADINSPDSVCGWSKLTVDLRKEGAIVAHNIFGTNLLAKLGMTPPILP